MQPVYPTRRKRSRFSNANRDVNSDYQAPVNSSSAAPDAAVDAPPLTLLRGKSLKRRQRNTRPPFSSLESNERQNSLNLPGTSLFVKDDDEEDLDDDKQHHPSQRYGAHSSNSKKRSLFLPSNDSSINDAQPQLAQKSADQLGDSIDPLDSFMQSIHKQTAAKRPRLRRDDEQSDISDASSDEKDAPKQQLRSEKRKVYEKLDHTKINYPSFHKNLYVEVPELAKLTHAQVEERRRRLGNIRIRGKRCPRPIDSWAQCGLSTSILNVLDRLAFEKPTAIQAQAIPCIMSGRDVIGIARTGSGKTLAFLLPIFRHIALRPRALAGEGPAALIIAPTRELAIQIYGDAKKFSRAVDIRCVCAYGGSGVKDQIAELKRGADLVVCTPGRMIDLLAMNSGRITNLLRVTFVVLDEADRMFDMGFGPQLTRIVENIRPDRQTVMFSATFPVQVERLARKVLIQPVEIMVGGNSVAAVTIDQNVEVRSEDSKFFRLLELLGTWYEKGSTLIFVDRQDNADRIFRDLCKARYKCLSLHGGMDQADRDSTVVDFKNGDIKVLVATSVAARGLDVKNLTLVVNYDVPSHYEDYVHRVGRTGRAGNSGTAFTFITPEQDAYAAYLVKALSRSARMAAEQGVPIGDDEAAKKAGDEAAEAAVPEKLREVAESFEKKRKSGLVKHGISSGYGGRGFKFDENDEYDAAKAALRKMQAKQYGLDDEGLDDEPENRQNRTRGNDSDGSDEGSDDDDIVPVAASVKANGSLKAGTQRLNSIHVSIPDRPLTAEEVERYLDEAVKQAESTANAQKLDEKARRALVAKAKASVLSVVSLRNKNAGMQRKASGSGSQSAGMAVVSAFGDVRTGNDADGDIGEEPSNNETGSESRFACELEINDYPQHARWQVTRKNSLNDVEEFTGCVITTRGNYYPSGRNPPPGERKLHFLIEGPTRHAVKMARRDIRQKLEEASEISRPSDNMYSKYSVV